MFPLHSPVQEGIAKSVEFPEGLLRIHHEGVPGDDPLRLTLHHCNEGVGGRLGPNPHAWKILFQQVPSRREHRHKAGILLVDQHCASITRQVTMPIMAEGQIQSHGISWQGEMTAGQDSEDVVEGLQMNLKN